MTRYTILVLAVFTAGCDPDKLISRRPTGRTWEGPANIGCTYLGYSCGVDVDGDLACGPTMEHGSQQAWLRFTEYEQIWETNVQLPEKAHRREVIVESRVLHTLEGCS